MEKTNVELSNPLPIRLPRNVVEDLKRVAAKAQRTLSQELRFRVLDSFKRIPKDQFE
jgi:hypothetical protein